ncbi:MAG: tRNA 4-thiouridine(8) synthase ThiI [Candidatus Marsarchaeota archaeon]|nr:tRNA 4-thiouridine(8) synthase ThiI [Candidatus Marsarchaeota archaeon]
MQEPYYDGIVIHFGELWLKGKNRKDFISLLERNIKSALGQEFGERLERLRDRMVLNVHSEDEVIHCERVLSKVFGISWYAPFRKSDSSIEAIVEKANSFFQGGESVRIEPHRALKSIGFDSKEIVAAFIHGTEKLNFVPEKDGKETLYIDVLENFSMLHKDRVKGAGGLPVGASGKAVVLLSGGIDSPVAAYYAMKRGLKPIFVHFYALQSYEELKSSKIPELLDVLLKYSGNAKVYYIPVHMFQIAAMKEDQKYEVVLFKRFIFETADRIAKIEKAKVMVTGESLGQVSSQTAENLKATSNGIETLFFRPLVGFDKQEIIDASMRLGFYPISIKPYKDACSLRSRNPVTRISPKALEAIYDRNGMGELPEISISKARVEFVP